MALLKESHRRSIMILVSVSLLSLVFSSLPLLFRSLNQFSIKKSYVFLFCNGLMVFIAKNSSLPYSDSSSGHHQLKDLGIAEPAVVNSQEHDNMVAENSPEPEVEEEEKRMIVAEDSHEEDEVAADTEKEEEDEVADAEIKEWVDDTEIEDEVADAETKEEEEEEEHEEVEELNKKCEDFIRKMKAAFCSEPSYSYHVCSDADHHTAMVTVR